MSIAKTTRPHLLTREAAAARIEALEDRINELEQAKQDASEAMEIYVERIEALEAALREIARQHLSDEMDEDRQDSAHFQGGYDIIVGIARAALAPEQDK